jgi:hypothetical protein
MTYAALLKMLSNVSPDNLDDEILFIINGEAYDELSIDVLKTEQSLYKFSDPRGKTFVDEVSEEEANEYECTKMVEPNNYYIKIDVDL